VNYNDIDMICVAVCCMLYAVCCMLCGLQKHKRSAELDRRWISPILTNFQCAKRVLSPVDVPKMQLELTVEDLRSFSTQPLAAIGLDKFIVLRCTYSAVFDVLCSAALCCAVLCCAVLCCAVLCCAVLCCAVLCCAVLCCAVLCCAVLCYAARFLLCFAVVC